MIITTWSDWHVLHTQFDLACPEVPTILLLKASASALDGQGLARLKAETDRLHFFDEADTDILHFSRRANDNKQNVKKQDDGGW